MTRPRYQLSELIAGMTESRRPEFPIGEHDPSQPRGYTRDDAEARIREQLERLSKLPDSARVTVLIGDLRKLHGKAA